MTLAPYSISPDGCGILVIQAALSSECGTEAAGLMGTAFGFHLGTLGPATRRNRTGDIARHGTMLSLVWIAAWNALALMLAWAFAGGGRAGVMPLAMDPVARVGLLLAQAPQATGGSLPLCGGPSTGLYPGGI